MRRSGRGRDRPSKAAQCALKPSSTLSGYGAETAYFGQGRASRYGNQARRPGLGASQRDPRLTSCRTCTNIRPASRTGISMQESTLQIGGQKIRMLQDGVGPAILFLHGAGGASWTPLHEHLTKNWRVML